MANLSENDIINVMTPVKKIWLDGKLVDWDKASIHLLTHGLHYGSSVFEGIRCYSTPGGPAIFRLDEHVQRLFSSASSLAMNIKFSQNDLREAIKTCIKTNELSDCYIRPIAYFGQGSLGLIPDKDSVSVAIACWPWVLKEGADKGIGVMISKYIRPHPDSVAIEAKVGGYYANSIMACQEARKNGFDEALLLDYKGFVAEGPGENIFMVKNDKLVTPAQGSILPGITRETIMILAQDIGLELEERQIKPEELENADELFFVGTAIEIWPILKLNLAEIGDGRIGKITKQLTDQYKKVVSGDLEKYSKWLALVNG